MAGINPFRPTSPINPGMFVGRLKEVERLESHLLQTLNRNPTNFALTGERGIGKSSLLNYIQWVARGEVPLPMSDRKLRFLVVDSDIDGNTTQLGLVQSIQRGLNYELRDSEFARNFIAKTFEFLQRLEVKGIKLGAADTPKGVEQAAIDDFSYSLATTAKRLCDPENGQSVLDANYDGILIIVDEADNASKDLSIGSFFKLVTERLERRGCRHVMFGIAGLPRLQEVLTASHKSAPRVFEELILDRLSDDEVGQVIDRCLKRAGELNSRQYSIEPAAKAMLTGLSEGYPHFIQQFGSSTFDADIDYVITTSDVISGAFGEHGAVHQIGERYYRDDYYNKVQQESYRQVLRIMAGRSSQEWITKVEIRKEFKGKNTTLDNAIHALLQKRIIVPRLGSKGVYRLQHKGFALWISLQKQEGLALMTGAEAEHSDEELSSTEELSEPNEPS